MASYEYSGYPETAAPGFFTAAAKVFMGGGAYTVVTSSTEENAFLLRNAADSGVQVELIGFRATVTNLPSAATSTSALIRFYAVDLAGLSASGVTSVAGKNMLIGGASSVATYHTSATATATATTLLPLSLELSVISGSKSLDILKDYSLIIPEGYALFVGITGCAGIATVVNVSMVWKENV